MNADLFILNGRHLGSRDVDRNKPIFTVWLTVCYLQRFGLSGDCAWLGQKIGNSLGIFCTKTVRHINLRFGGVYYCIFNYCSEFLCDSEKNMADTKRALKNNRVILALTKSTVRFIRNTKKKRDS